MVLRRYYVIIMKKYLLLLANLFWVSFFLFAYNYGEKIDLPGAVRGLLPDTPDILASAAADLDGDGRLDYVLIVQTRERGNSGIGSSDGRAVVSPVEGPAKDVSTSKDASMTDNAPMLRDVPMTRELFIILNRGGRYGVALRSRRAVLGSADGVEDEDPFLALRARTETFTLLHKFYNRDEAWGTAARFRYSVKAGTWCLDYFYGHDGDEFDPGTLGRVTIKDFDLSYYLATGTIVPRPEAEQKVVRYGDDILYTENGVAFLTRPDGSNRRYLVGDRFFRTLGFPNWSADKNRIAFIRHNDLYEIDLDSGYEWRVIKNVLKESFYRYAEQGEVTAMRWAADGNNFVYTGYRDTVNYKPLYLFLADSSGTIRVLKESDQKHPISSICWSPDSKKIAYYDGSVLTVMDLALGKDRVLSNKAGSGIAWSADGKRILTAVKGAYDIIDTETGSTREIPERLAWSGYGPLFWSADEQYVLYYSSDDIMMTPLKNGEKGRIVIGKTYGLIDGLSW